MTNKYIRVKCIGNSADYLKQFEFQELSKTGLGRFGSTGYTDYKSLEIGQEFLVLGIIHFQYSIQYLIEVDDYIFFWPAYLFEIIDNRVSPGWSFRLIDKDEELYPFIQGIWGYYVLTHELDAYQSLIVDRNPQSINAFKAQTIQESFYDLENRVLDIFIERYSNVLKNIISHKFLPMGIRTINNHGFTIIYRTDSASSSIKPYVLDGVNAQVMNLQKGISFILEYDDQGLISLNAYTHSEKLPAKLEVISVDVST